MLSQNPLPDSPDWWLLRLGQRLQDETPRFNLLESYWLGDPPLPHGNRKMREAYRRLQRIARTNFGNLVTEAMVERQKVVGFRAGSDATIDADKEAWKWWQANDLDANQCLVHRAAAQMSRSYVIVGERAADEVYDDDDVPGGVLITPEDPRQVIHESAPEDRRDVKAALKTWWDDVDGCQRAILFLPDTIHYFATRKRARDSADPLWTAANWFVDDSEHPGGSVVNALGEVPVVPFVNRPNMAGEGLGEYEDCRDILDRINTVILDRLVVSAMQAYRQRWATGIEMTDENGNPDASFDPGADMLWAIADEKAKLGEFGITDVTPIIKAAESDVMYLAAITRTPPSYLLAGIVNVSGNALALTETGLVSKITERNAELGSSWERVYRLAAKVAGSAVSVDAEVIWTDPQFRSMNEMAAASVQLVSAGVPWRTRMRLLGFSPQDIDRMEAERLHDAMMASILAPLPMSEGGSLAINRGVTWTEQNVLPGKPTNESPAPSPNVDTPGGTGPPSQNKPGSTPAKAGPQAGTQSPSKPPK